LIFSTVTALIRVLRGKLLLVPRDVRAAQLLHLRQQRADPRVVTVPLGGEARPLS
jgi:hypothetical protein